MKKLKMMKKNISKQVKKQFSDLKKIGVKAVKIAKKRKNKRIRKEFIDKLINIFPYKSIFNVFK